MLSSCLLPTVKVFIRGTTKTYITEIAGTKRDDRRREVICKKGEQDRKRERKKEEKAKATATVGEKTQFGYSVAVDFGGQNYMNE